MKIVLINKFLNYGGAAIASKRILSAFKYEKKISAILLVQDYNPEQPNIIGLYKGHVSHYINLFRLFIEKFIFLFFEKDKKQRFLFSIPWFGIDISGNGHVKNADILHLQWFNQNFLSIKSFRKLAQTGKPIVWTLHDMWAFTGGCHHSRDCTNYAQNCGNCKLYLKNPAPHDLSYKIWRNKKRAYSNTQITIVTCSNWLAQKARSSSLFANSSILSIPNPINEDLYKPINIELTRKKLSLDSAKKYIMFGAVNSTDYFKGFTFFVDALKILIANSNTNYENIEVLLFGNSDAQLIKQIPLRVINFGIVKNEQKLIEIYNAADVYVTSSLQENLPNTIMEALSCGTPVIGFNIGGIPEMIDHKQNGYLAHYESSDDLATGISWTIFNDNYQQLCEKARNKAVKNYSESVIAKKYFELYKKILNE